MLCVNPFVVSIGRAFGCGRCYWCRKKRSAEWTHRIMLEAAAHKENSFVTLTYSDKHLPQNGSLEPRHVQLFLKRLRKRIEPARLRFFFVGEYGSRTFRPHYHGALFGYPPCLALNKRQGSHCRCSSCIGISESWRADGRNGEMRGFITLGALEPASAAYVAAYATKSMEPGDHDKRTPTGCIPEFSRKSLRPGIGAGILDDIASQLMRVGADRVEDIPRYLSHGTVKWPIGRYLRSGICERVGISKDERAKHAYSILDEEMQPLREMALQAPAGQRSMAFKELLVSQNNQKRLQKATQYKIRKMRKKL